MHRDPKKRAATGGDPAAARREDINTVDSGRRSHFGVNSSGTRHSALSTVGRGKPRATSDSRMMRDVKHLHLGTNAARLRHSRACWVTGRFQSKSYAADGRCAEIVLKNSDFRLDHICRGQGGTLKNFGWEPGMGRRSPAGELRSPAKDSLSVNRVKRSEYATFRRAADLGVFQHNPERAAIRRRRRECVRSTHSGPPSLVPSVRLRVEGGSLWAFVLD